jgi:hypothetical protein
VACAPQDNPLKGSKKNKSENESKIKESAYLGSKYDLSLYASYKILDVKRVFDIPLSLLRSKKTIEFDQIPGFELLKKCRNRNSGISIDVLKNTPDYLEFVLSLNDCSTSGSVELSHKISGREFFRVYFETDNKNNNIFRKSIEKIEYNTFSLIQNLKANEKNQLFRPSSEAEIFENRGITIRKRSENEYNFLYESKAETNQSLVSKSFKVDELLGSHNYFAEGIFNLKGNKVTQMSHVNMELRHKSKREVYLKGRSGRHLFTNDDNQLLLMAKIQETSEFDKMCSFIKGKLDISRFENKNQKRNRFHLKSDNDSENSIKLDFTNNKGTPPEDIYFLNDKNQVKKLGKSKCLLDASSFYKSLTPKTPLDLFFIR